MRHLVLQSIKNNNKSAKQGSSLKVAFMGDKTEDLMNSAPFLFVRSFTFHCLKTHIAQGRGRYLSMLAGGPIKTFLHPF